MLMTMKLHVSCTLSDNFALARLFQLFRSHELFLDACKLHDVSLRHFQRIDESLNVSVYSRRRRLRLRLRRLAHCVLTFD